MLLIKSQCLDEPIDIGELMSYSLTPVPHSLGTPDGFFNKTNKAAMLHYLIDDTPEEVVVPANSMYIQDGNALFHALKNLPPTFGEICLKVLDQMVAKTKPVDFKLFLTNEDNKLQLCQLLLRVWGSKAAASRLEKCGSAVAVVEGKAYQLETIEGDVSIL